ncbi:hypothetical protein J2Z50_006649 [Ensifer mexicanus]|nr:hypothetical protein [Sinorhizobium mexicanum]
MAEGSPPLKRSVSVTAEAIGWLSKKPIKPR